jgi:tRNA threonylcarbamoyladenosine biosynthesis protein TsaB
VIVLAFDTATPATVVGVARDGELLAARRHDPGPGERPGHGPLLLALATEALAEVGLAWDGVERLGVGIGPGTFTGLRIGVATGRALAQGLGAELVAVPTPAALALAARDGEHATLAVLDARRGEAFAAAWDPAGAPLLEPVAWPPERLAEVLATAPGPWLAVGDGAVRFREALEASGATVPDDASPLHRVDAGALCRLTAEGPPVQRDGLVPHYVRAPDAVPRR